jgi:hypothetical protein
MCLTAVAVPVFGYPTTIPASLANGTDYIVFNGSSYPGGNLICPPGADGCGGAFGATLYAGTTPTGTANPVTVWCVDYQLNVTTDSQYITDISSVNNITATNIAANDSNVRYGTLDQLGSSNAVGWSNSVTDPLGLDPNSANPGGDSNSAAYRYTLAAALVGQYQNDANGLIGGSPQNLAIQEAIWYVTYNNEYASTGSGDQTLAWAPFDLPAANASDPNNYAYWVKYAEQNASSVTTSQWAVVSGPASATGTLLGTAPGDAPNEDGYPSFQTFLVQLSGSAGSTHDNIMPEPGYYLLVVLALAGMFAAARFRHRANRA